MTRAGQESRTIPAQVRVRTCGTRFPWSKALLAILEVSFGAYMATFIAISLIYHFALSSVPFLMIFAGGYFYVGLSSLWLMWQTHSAARERVVAEAVELS